MKYYRVAAFSFRSVIPFPEIAESSEPSCEWELVIAHPFDESAVTWFNTWTIGGRTWAEFGKVGDAHVVRFTDYATFFVEWKRSQIRAVAGARVTENTLRHLFLDQIVPLIIGESGLLVLHASAAKIEGRVVGLVGSAGRGKSTLAAALVNEGAEIVTDDCLVLRRQQNLILAQPTYPSVRLLPDSFAILAAGGAETSDRISQYNEKRRLIAARASDEESPLSHLFFLTTEQPVDRPLRLEKVALPEVFFRLMPNNFFLDTTNADRLAEKFHQVCDVAENVACYDLSFTRDYAVLGEVARTIRSWVQ